MSIQNIVGAVMILILTVAFLVVIFKTPKNISPDGWVAMFIAGFALLLAALGLLKS